jgi:hypothetical protein
VILENCLSDGPGLLEAEISLPAVHRLADDHVIKHLDLEDPSSLVESPSRAKISFARAWVTGYAACGITGVGLNRFAVCNNYHWRLDRLTYFGPGKLG